MPSRKPTDDGFFLSTEKTSSFQKIGKPYISLYSYNDIPDITYHDHCGDFELVLINHGYGYHYINDTVVEIKAGDIFFLDPASRHSFFPVDRENSTRLQVINCVFSRANFEKLENGIPQLGEAFDFFTKADENHILQLCHNCLDRGLTEFCQPLIYHIEQLNREDTPLNIQSIILLISTMVLEIYRRLLESSTKKAKSSQSPLLMQAVNSINTHFLQPDFTISGLYDTVFVSKSHLCTLFKEYLNTSPVRYLNTMRIQHACELIRNKSFCPPDIYLQSGYNEYNTFYINFKKITGFSIRNYMKALNICLPAIKSADRENKSLL